MPVTPYPRRLRALHQINRHQVERAPRWTVTFGPRASSPTSFRPTVIRGLTEEESRDLLRKLNTHFRVIVSKVRGPGSRLPGQRRPSDG